MTHDPTPGTLGSRAIGESTDEHFEREATWMEDHACQHCGLFSCDGHCEDNQPSGDSWSDYDDL